MAERDGALTVSVMTFGVDGFVEADGDSGPVSGLIHVPSEDPFFVEAGVDDWRLGVPRGDQETRPPIIMTAAAACDDGDEGGFGRGHSVGNVVWFMLSIFGSGQSGKHSFLGGFADEMITPVY